MDYLLCSRQQISHLIMKASHGRGIFTTQKAQRFSKRPNDVLVCVNDQLILYSTFIKRILQ